MIRRKAHPSRSLFLTAVFALSFSFLSAAPPPATPVNPASQKTDTKAAFLFNLSSHIDWKDPNIGKEGSPLIFAVMEDDSLGPALKQLLEAKGLNARVLVIRNTDQIKTAREFFNVLSIDSQNPVANARIIKDLKGSRVLTVGEAKDFLRQGGMVQVEQTKDTLQFRVNEASINAEGLKAQPVLKKLAGTVLEAPAKDQKQIYEAWKKLFDEAQANGAALPVPTPEGGTSVWERAGVAFKWMVILVLAAGLIAVGWRLTHQASPKNRKA